MKQYQRTDGVMYLYDGDDKEVLVYPIIPNKNKLYEFKKAGVETIPASKRCLQAVTTSNSQVLKRAFSPEVLQERMTTIKASKLSFGDKFYDTNHDVIPLGGEPNINLLETYYKKLGTSNYLEVIDDIDLSPSNIKGLVIEYGFYNFDGYRTYKKSDIINIPKSLLRLEQFMDGCFDQIDEDQIEEFLSLYEGNINHPIYRLSLSEIDQMAKYFPQTVALPLQIEDEIKNDAKVMSLMKKRAQK